MVRDRNCDKWLLSKEIVEREDQRISKSGRKANLQVLFRNHHIVDRNKHIEKECNRQYYLPLFDGKKRTTVFLI